MINIVVRSFGIRVIGSALLLFSIGASASSHIVDGEESTSAEEKEEAPV